MSPQAVLQCEQNGITAEAFTMKTVSLKMPAALYRKLERTARTQKQSKSALVRAALEQYLNGGRAGRPQTALEAAGPWIGCAEGPGDLSTNPKYMEGFGK
jgi:hypothetical protein